jgi:hypothetical protein
MEEKTLGCVMASLGVISFLLNFGTANYSLSVTVLSFAPNHSDLSTAYWHLLMNNMGALILTFFKFIHLLTCSLFSSNIIWKIIQRKMSFLQKKGYGRTKGNYKSKLFLIHFHK